MNDLIINKETLVDIADAIREKTGNLAKIQVGQLADEIEKIQVGEGTLPNLSNPAAASDALAGKEFIDQEGNKVTGTIATKTSSNLTASGATVTVPAGYYAANVTKSVATATQATPSVSIDANGKITADTQKEMSEIGIFSFLESISYIY